MKGYRYKKGGWYGESYRHYLAAKGVKSTYDKHKYFAHTDLYKDKGFDSRKDYLENLAYDYDVPVEDVVALAQLLGPNEDFDGLVASVEDHARDLRRMDPLKGFETRRFNAIQKFAQENELTVGFVQEYANNYQKAMGSDLQEALDALQLDMDENPDMYGETGKYYALQRAVEPITELTPLQDKFDELTAKQLALRKQRERINQFPHFTPEQKETFSAELVLKERKLLEDEMMPLAREIESKGGDVPSFGLGQPPGSYFSKSDDPEDDWDDMRMREDMKLSKYGLPDRFQQRMSGESLQVLQEKNGKALVQYYDSSSPASESPYVYQIRDDKGNVLWSSGVTQMAEFHAEGGARGVPNMLRKEAQEKFDTFDAKKKDGYYANKYYAYEPTFVAGDLSAIAVDGVGTAGAATVALIPLAVTAGALYVGAKGAKKAATKKEDGGWWARKVDLEKYQGTWEQAAVSQPPPRFQRDCKKVKANYKLNEDGTVRVKNTCKTDDGTRTVEGTARSISDDNRKLRVSFGPFRSGTYEIVDVDPDYKKAVVKGGQAVWVLER